MSHTLTLHRPALKETGARRAWLSDPETMAYNKGGADDIPGYDPETGCIDFPVGDWRYWRDVWLYREPDRYAAFLKREDGLFVGEACYYYDFDSDRHGAGVIVQHPYRHRGYGTEALRLLIERAFARDEIKGLFAELPLLNDDAVRMYMGCGFREERTSGGLIRLTLDK